MSAERELNFYRIRRNMRFHKTTDTHPGQIPMIMALLHSSADTVTDLARELRISPAAAGVTVKRMESKGLVVREDDDYDSRKSRIHLTEKGRDIALAVVEDVQEMFSIMLDGFTAEECDQMCSFYRRMAENLKNSTMAEPEQKGDES